MRNKRTEITLKCELGGRMKLGDIKVKCSRCKAVATLDDMGIGWEESEDEPLELYCLYCHKYGILGDWEVAE